MVSCFGLVYLSFFFFFEDPLLHNFYFLWIWLVCDKVSLVYIMWTLSSALLMSSLFHL